MDLIDDEINIQDLQSKRSTVFSNICGQSSRIKLAGSLKTYFGSSYFAPTREMLFRMKLWEVINQMRTSNARYTWKERWGNWVKEGKLVTSLIIADCQIITLNNHTSTVDDRLCKG